MDANKEAEEILKKLPPAPSGVERWIRQTGIQKAYLIFDNRENKAVCTRCGRTFTLRKTHGAEHNEKCSCPYCKTEAIWKKSYYGRKKLTEQFRVLIFTHKGKTVYGTLFEVDADFEEFGKARISRWISALYRFTETEQIYLKHHPGWGDGDFWESRKEVKLPHTPTGYNWGTWCKYERTAVYTDNLESVFMKSCLNYHYDKELFWRFDAYDYIRYIDQCLKYKSMELLRKAGFERLVLDRVCGDSTKSLYIRGETLKKILRLPKRWHKKVRELDMGTQELSTFQSLAEAEKQQVTKEILECLVREESCKKGVQAYGSFFEAAIYIERQSRPMWMYRDYLNQAYTLGIDLKRKENLYPKNLKKAHDETMRQIKEQQTEMEMKGIQDQADRIREKYPDYHRGELLIRVAASQAELNRESGELCHCVRMYGKQMLAGECTIFFIRKEKEPDKPFYTLELSPKKRIVQCRGFKNCGMTEEVKTFVKAWAKQYNLKHNIEDTEQEAA